MHFDVAERKSVIGPRALFVAAATRHVSSFPRDRDLEHKRYRAIKLESALRYVSVGGWVMSHSDSAHGSVQL